MGSQDLNQAECLQTGFLKQGTYFQLKQDKIHLNDFSKYPERGADTRPPTLSNLYLFNCTSWVIFILKTMYKQNYKWF